MKIIKRCPLTVSLRQKREERHISDRAALYHRDRSAPSPEVTQDFIDFILSNEGQTVVAKGYTPVDGSAPAYSPTVSHLEKLLSLVLRP